MSGRGTAHDPLRIAVFASGGGSNFQALVEHARARLGDSAARPASAERPATRRPAPGERRAGEVSVRAEGRAAPTPAPARAAFWRPVLLVSDREGAGAIERARRAGVDPFVVPVRGRPGADVARETLALLEDRGVDALLLAGYLRLVPEEVVRRYRGRILNIHPALLPAFGGAGMYGMNVHRAVIEAGVLVTGATVHLVDEEYDRGRIIAQWPVPVLPEDTPESVAARVLNVEHRLYACAVDHASAAWRAGREPGPLAGPGEGFRLAEAAADVPATATAADPLNATAADPLTDTAADPPNDTAADPPTDIEREAS